MKRRYTVLQLDGGKCWSGLGSSLDTRFTDALCNSSCMQVSAGSAASGNGGAAGEAGQGQGHPYHGQQQQQQARSRPSQQAIRCESSSIVAIRCAVVGICMTLSFYWTAPAAPAAAGYGPPQQAVRLTAWSKQFVLAAAAAAL
jgi:hypothetical protein